MESTRMESNRQWGNGGEKRVAVYMRSYKNYLHEKLNVSQNDLH